VAWLASIFPADGPDGDLQWRRVFDGPGDDSGRFVAIDDQDREVTAAESAAA
jgi:hypothetical protein